MPFARHRGGEAWYLLGLASSITAGSSNGDILRDAFDDIGEARPGQATVLVLVNANDNALHSLARDTMPLVHPARAERRIGATARKAGAIRGRGTSLINFRCTLAKC